MDLNDLTVFAAVGDTLGISSAAKRLGVPKSTVSRALSRLESELRVELVHRTTRKVSLSSAGAVLHARVSPLLSSLEQSVHALPEREAVPSGRLRVTLPVDFAATVMAEILVRFMARYPEVQVEAHLSNAFVDIVAEGIDVAVRISQGRLRDSSLVASPIGSVRMQLFASPQYLALRGVPRSPDDLDQHEWVVSRAQRKIKLTSAGATRPVVPRGRLDCDDMFFARESARAGAGIALLPEFLAEPDRANGSLVCVLPRWTVQRGRVWLVHPSARNLPAKVTAFRSFVAEALKKRGLG